MQVGIRRSRIAAGGMGGHTMKPYRRRQYGRAYGEAVSPKAVWTFFRIAVQGHKKLKQKQM
ncbi:MAG: hypothetical protein J6A07_03200 [Firmicutes bacterium]|nr:hypothetical protein [Bacillota bacterium]